MPDLTNTLGSYISYTASKQGPHSRRSLLRLIKKKSLETHGVAPLILKAVYGSATKIQQKDVHSPHVGHF